VNAEDRLHRAGVDGELDGRAVLEHDAASEATELARRCSLIEELDLQGLPLLRRDYVTLVVATVLIPIVLIIVGNLK
jgi:hypothetical protein